jgi:hypothetical protein
LTALLPWVTLSLASCQQHDEPDIQTETYDRGHVTDVYFNVKLTLPAGITIDDATRSEAASSSQFLDYRGNVVDEDAIRYVTIFVVDYDPQTNVEDWSSCQCSTLEVEENQAVYDAETDAYTVDLNFMTTVAPGNKRVYVSANLTKELIEQCKKGGLFTAGSKTDDDYYSVISKFVNPENGAVAMFSSNYFEIKVNGDVYDTNADGDGSQNNPYLCQMTLERLVAKVLLACDMQSDSNDNDCIKVKANIPDYYSTNYPGWMHLSSVRYKLGTTNRTTYFYKHYLSGNEDEIVDPNYYVADQLTANSSGNWSYVGDYANDFTYSVDIKNDFIPAFNENQSVDNYDSKSTCMQAVKFDANRMPTEQRLPNRYKEGLYCLENTLDNNWSSISNYASFLSQRSNWFKGPRMIATTIDIETRYIPAVIVGKGGVKKSVDYREDSSLPISQKLARLLSLSPNCYAKEDSARDFIISESANPAAASPTYYSIYLDDCFYFLTYEAAQELITLAKENGFADYFVDELKTFEIYNNGLVYYHTYLSRITDNVVNQSISGIVRNNYYILRCSYMSVPSPVDNAVKSMTTYRCPMKSQSIGIAVE